MSATRDSEIKGGILVFGLLAAAAALSLGYAIGLDQEAALRAADRRAAAAQAAADNIRRSAAS